MLVLIKVQHVRAGITESKMIDVNTSSDILPTVRSMYPSFHWDFLWYLPENGKAKFEFIDSINVRRGIYE